MLVIRLAFYIIPKADLDHIQVPPEVVPLCLLRYTARSVFSMYVRSIRGYVAGGTLRSGLAVVWELLQRLALKLLVILSKRYSIQGSS